MRQTLDSECDDDCARLLTLTRDDNDKQSVAIVFHLVFSPEQMSEQDKRLASRENHLMSLTLDIVIAPPMKYDVQLYIEYSYNYKT